MIAAMLCCYKYRTIAAATTIAATATIAATNSDSNGSRNGQLAEMPVIPRAGQWHVS